MHHPLAILSLTALLVAAGCAGTSEPGPAEADDLAAEVLTPPPVEEPPPAGEAPPSAESWRCRNDIEVRCGEGTCEVESEGGFTPMSVTVDGSGAISVCAYSGCWEGTGAVLSGEPFLVLIGRGLEFSTARGVESAAADIVIAIDRADRVATLKAGEFVHPLLCERAGGEQ